MYTTDSSVIRGGAFFFKSASLPSDGTASSYPVSWVSMADLGQTFNASLTAQYVAQFSKQVGGAAGAILAGDGAPPRNHSLDR